MLKVSFIVPTWKYFFDPFKLQPLLELYFSTVLRENFPSDFLDIDIIDLRNYRKQKTKNEKLSHEEFCDMFIPQRDVYLYWSPKTADFCEIENTVEFLRKKYPKAIHAAGGTHVDNFVEECSVLFDAVVTGPGERSFIKIIEGHSNGSLQRVYKDDWGEVHYKDFPFPKRDFLPKEAIVNRRLFAKYGKKLATSVLFSRGCPFKCSYCVYNIPNALQVRDPGDIETEIGYLKDNYQVEAINVRDEMCIGLSEKVYIPFLNAIGNSNVIWRGQTRVGIKNSLISLAKDTGCVELVLGVESVCQNVLDGINKKQTIEEAIETINYCRETGIKTRINLILGLPYESPDIVDRTVKFIEDHKPDYASVSGLCPVPGSDMFRNPSKFGIKSIDHCWDKHAHLMFRFDDDEDHGLPFEYDEKNAVGRAFSRNEIVQNIKQLQKYLNDNNMCY